MQKPISGRDRQIVTVHEQSPSRLLAAAKTAEDQYYNITLSSSVSPSLFPQESF